MKRQPNLELYRRNETETYEYIKRVLIKRKIPFTEYKRNIFSFRFKNQPLFVAHMDTVGESNVKRKISYQNNVLMRKGNYVLGADDKAGVDILLKNIDDINFVFTHGEETGAIGAYDLLLNRDFLDILDKVPFAVEYDRMGYSDLISYCASDLEYYIGQLTHYVPAAGLFTDVSIWEEYVPGVNLSCGYYGHHTGQEKLIISEWLTALDTLPKLNVPVERFEISYIPFNDYSNYVPNHQGYYGYKSVENYWDSFETDSFNLNDMVTCSQCNCSGDINEEFYEDDNGNVLCSQCVESIYGIRRLT